jgi:hypothetical protein
MTGIWINPDLFFILLAERHEYHTTIYLALDGIDTAVLQFID